MTASFHLTDVTPSASVSTLFVALDLSRTFWVAAVHAPHADKIGRHRVAPEAAAVLALIIRLREQAERALAAPVPVVAVVALSTGWVLPSLSPAFAEGAPVLHYNRSVTAASSSPSCASA